MGTSSRRQADPLSIPAEISFLGSFSAVAIAVGLGRWIDRHVLLVMVLAGMVISAFFKPLIATLKVLADPLNQLPSITFWLLGGLHRITADTLFMAQWSIMLACAGLSSALRWNDSNCPTIYTDV